ncbi:MAG: lysophospholipid acyltransferase family protein, partial [Acidobacteriota bacterium]
MDPTPASTTATDTSVLRRRARARALPAVLRGATWLFGSVPWPVAQRLGSLLGRLAWRVNGRDRRRTLDHLAIAFPDMDPRQRRALGHASLRHLGTSVGELLHLLRRPPGEAQKHVRVEGFEEIERLRTEGRPIVVLMAHCGNWELTSVANLSHGLGLAASARELDEEVLHDLAVRLRARLGSETIPRGSRGAGRQLLRVLRSGGALAMLIDQDLKAPGIWVPFFGRMAHTPPGAAEIALRFGAAVVPTFCERLGDGSHILRFHPTLDLPDDVTGATAVMTAAIEKQVRRRPEQWVWLHRRWRRPPPD